MGQLVASHSLREFYEAKGAEEFRRAIQTHISDCKPEELRQFSLRELAEAIHGGKLPATPEAFMEAADHTTFPTITGEVIQRMVISEYDSYPRTSQRCCVDVPGVVDVQTLRVPGLFQKGAMERRKPGGFYDESEIKELYVQKDVGDPFGRILSIKYEDIRWDRTGTLLQRAQMAIGREAAMTEEKEFWYVFADAGTKLGDVAQYAYYPAGTRTAIYSTTTTADSTGQTPRYTSHTSNALADMTDVQNTDSYLAKQTDLNGNPINVPATNLIVPRALAVTARKIRATLSADVQKTGGVVPTSFVGGFGNDGTYDFDIVVEPLLDTLSTSNWWWGNPKMQFYRFTVRELGVIVAQLSQPHPDYMKRDVVAQIRGHWHKVTMALDYRYVCKSAS